MAIVREAGARQVCLAQFEVSEAIELAANCVTGDEAQRKGAVIIAAANVFIRDSVEDTAVVTQAAADVFKISIEIASNADEEIWGVDVFGYLV